MIFPVGCALYHHKVLNVCRCKCIMSGQIKDAARAVFVIAHDNHTEWWEVLLA